MATAIKRLIEEATVEEARKRKWEIGREVHGPVMELDPLEELYHEELDGINYCRILMGDGQLSESERVYFLTLSKRYEDQANITRQIWQRSKNRIYVPTEFPFS